jgi:hypothetical protein
MGEIHPCPNIYKRLLHETMMKTIKKNSFLFSKAKVFGSLASLGGASRLAKNFEFFLVSAAEEEEY